MAVESGEGFVEQHERRSAGEHPCDRDAARLAAGDLARRRTPDRAEVEPVAELCDPDVARSVGIRDAERDVLVDAQVRKEIRILGQVAERPAMEREARRKERRLAERDAAAVRRLDAGDAREDRALARAGDAEQAARGPGGDAQRHVDGEARPQLDDVRVKHRATAAVRGCAPATATAAPSRGRSRAAA